MTIVTDKLRLWKYELDLYYGRINSTFVAREFEMREIFSESVNIYFGEIAGKHSEVVESVSFEDFTPIPGYLTGQFTEEELKCFEVGLNILEMAKEELAELGEEE